MIMCYKFSVAFFLALSLAVGTTVNAQCSGSSCDYAAGPAVDSYSYAGSSFVSAPAIQNYSGYISTNAQPAPLPQPQYTNYAPPIVGGPIGSATPVYGAPVNSAPIYNAPIASAPIYNAPIASAPIYNAPIAQPAVSYPSQTFTGSPFGSLGTFQNFAAPTCSGGNCPFR